MRDSIHELKFHCNYHHLGEDLLKFYDNEINLNKNLLKFGDKKQRKQAEKNLLELRGRLMFELRAANKQIKDILNNPNYE